MTNTHQILHTRYALHLLRELVTTIEDEIRNDPPDSHANRERRGELDQLHDMIDRRRDPVLEQNC